MQFPTSRFRQVFLSLCVAVVASLGFGQSTTAPTPTPGTASTGAGFSTVGQAKRLPDPPPSAIPGIIQRFSAKERLFRQLLKHNYTYTESIKVEELDDDGTPTGAYEQTNDIQFTLEGQRQIVCTFCPQPSLKNISVTSEDIDDFFNMDMYTISVDELNQYDVRYVDHEPVDQLTAYVFEIKPKQIEKGHRYFQGKVWVDDRDIQIVKSVGKAVPDEFDKHGQPTNTFLPFETYRQEVDGKYWFPVYTHTDSMLGEQRVKIVIRFKDYKQFRATTRILETETLDNKQQIPANSKPK
jgi:hypothetical protein